ncbi:MAG: hypothetical protein QXG03_05645, partial [Halalkalicoccus sp.]
MSGDVSRRATLGLLGAGALGVGAIGSASAADDGFEVRDDGPNPMALVTSDGEEWPEEPDEEMELFDAEPEFPPYVNYEGMVEEFGEDAERYLEPHGVPNLLHSRRLVVAPDAEEDGAATWGEFSGASASARIEPEIDQGRRCSRVEIEFEGLYPEGVYTVWVVHRPAFHRPLGGNDGEHNAFTADEDGTFTLDVVDLPEELTLPPGATADPGDEEEGFEAVDPVPATEYPLHEIPGEFMFIVAYHYDNRTWGPQPS